MGAEVSITALPHPRRAVEPFGIVHAARYAGDRQHFTTACAVYPAPVDAVLEHTADRPVNCPGCLAAVETVTHCPAAHAEDPSPCSGPVMVTVLDKHNHGAAGCEQHASRLLASLEGGRVYGLPTAPEGAAIRVFNTAGTMRPFEWLDGGAS